MMTGLLAAVMLSGCGTNDAPANSDAPNVVSPRETSVPVALSTGASPAKMPAAASHPQAAETLDTFWVKFRKAALGNDVAGIAALSAPIVTQHGLLDDSPEARLSAEKAAQVLLKLLDDTNSTDGQGRTNRQLLEVTAQPKLDPEWSTERLRLGDMEFAQGPQGWRFVEFYYEP